MATTHIYAVGRIPGGAVDLLLPPRRQQPVCSDTHGCHCYAYSHGYDDAKDGYLPEPLHHVSALCCIERYMAGHRDGLLALNRFVAKPREPFGRDGLLQGMIDCGAELQELIDGMADDEFNRHGC